MTRYPQHFCEIICDVTNHACRTTCENLIPNEHRENFTLFFFTLEMSFTFIAQTLCMSCYTVKFNHSTERTRKTHF